MDDLYYLLFSLVEGFFILMLMCSIFSIKLKNNIQDILIIDIIITLLMFILREHQIFVNFLPFVNLLLLLVGVWLILRIKIVDSLYVSVLMSLTILWIQGMLYLIASFMFELTPLQIQRDYSHLFLIQLAEVLILTILIFITRKYFKDLVVDKKMKKDREDNKLKNFIFISLSLSGLILSIFFSLEPLMITVIFMTTCIFALVYLGLKRGVN